MFGPLAWSHDSRYLYFQDVLERDEPIWRMRVRDGRFDRVVDFHTLLEVDVLRCGFEELANKAYSLYVRQNAAEKAKLLRMVLSN